MIGRATGRLEVAERASDVPVSEANGGSSERCSDGDAVSRDAFAEEWRVACPQGHVRLDPADGTETAYCESCERSYDWAVLVDRKATSASG